jgi:molybdopterin/thiamine biosynthesis adenylyltransferase
MVSEALFQEIGLPAPPAAPVERHSRLPNFLGLRQDPGPILNSLKVGVIGLGSVGRHVAIDLARQQIAALWCCDPAQYKRESLLTQPIGPEDIGNSKALNTARLCKRISPTTRVFASDQSVQALDATAFEDVDFVVLGTDNLAAEVEVGQRCLWLRKRLLHASVHGETMVAQVRYFFNSDGQGPCPTCGFSTAEWVHLNQETIFSCQGPPTGKIVSAPTMSVSALCSLAANLALIQLYRLVLGLGTPLVDCMVEYCGYTHRTVTTPLARNPQCPCEHQAWTPLAAPAPLPVCTPCELAAAAGVTSGMPLTGVSFLLENNTFVERSICTECGRLQEVRQFVTTFEDQAGRCTSCSAHLKPHPFHSYRPTPASVLFPVLDQPLNQLGAGSPRWVVVRRPERSVLFRDTGHSERISP